MINYTQWKSINLLYECRNRNLAIDGHRSILVNCLAQNDFAKRVAATAESLDDYNSDNDPQGTQRIEILRLNATLLKRLSKIERDNDVTYHDHQAIYHASRSKQHQSESATAEKKIKHQAAKVEAENRSSAESILRGVQSRTEKRITEEAYQTLEEESAEEGEVNGETWAAEQIVQQQYQVDQRLLKKERHLKMEKEQLLKLERLNPSYPKSAKMLSDTQLSGYGSDPSPGIIQPVASKLRGSFFAFPCCLSLLLADIVTISRSLSPLIRSIFLLVQQLPCSFNYLHSKHRLSPLSIFPLRVYRLQFLQLRRLITWKPNVLLELVWALLPWLSKTTTPTLLLFL